MAMDKCSKTAMEKTQKGQANTGPVRKSSTVAQRKKGGATNNGGVFGNWQKSRKPKM